MYSHYILGTHQKSLVHPALSLTLDSWTSLATQTYLALTIHGISEEWEFESAVLDIIPVTSSETGIFIAEAVREVLHEWKIPPSCIVAATTDGVSNVQAAIQLLGFKWVWCFCYLLNLVVQAALSHISFLPAAKARVKFFCACPFFV